MGANVFDWCWVDFVFCEQHAPQLWHVKNFIVVVGGKNQVGGGNQSHFQLTNSFCHEFGIFCLEFLKIAET